MIRSHETNESTKKKFLKLKKIRVFVLTASLMCPVGQQASATHFSSACFIDVSNCSADCFTSSSPTRR